MQRYCCLFLMILISSCMSYPEAIEDVLRQAGSNRKELEKVLKYYGKNPADSLKLRAAEFLIVNMPGKYSEYYDAPWNDASSVFLRWTSSSDKQLVLDTYQLGEPVIEDDITHITAEYLVNNIELAFKVWQEVPWGKHITFDVFCEEVLPYRVSTEPLENWREKVLASFADLYKSFRKDTAITAVEACSQVNDKLPRFRIDKDFPTMSFSQLMSTTRGVCDHQSAFAVFVMRGLGVPVTCDYTPLWPYSLVGHAWNSVRDSSDIHISFMGTEVNPGNANAISTAKVYRNKYANQQNIQTDAANIPPILDNMNYIVDVTSEYGNCFDVRVPVLNGHLNQTGHVFLSMLQEMNWHPVAWGAVDSDSILFLSVGANILYQPVYYYRGVQSPASYPFIVGNNGEYRFFHTDSLQTVTLTSIAPINHDLLQRMVGGKFEVANRSDFSDAKTIHTIETVPSACFHTVSVKHPFSYRYIRYVSPVDGFCNVSILEFYDENDEKLHGTAIGTPGAFQNGPMTYDKVFDGDVDTYFDALPGDSWTGLDFGEPRRISKIRYLPRTTGNIICEEQVYELFCWNGNEWHSMGKQTATTQILQYQAPVNALFFLKNVTKNRKHTMPFIIENGAQKWF